MSNPHKTQGNTPPTLSGQAEDGHWRSWSLLPAQERLGASRIRRPMAPSPARAVPGTFKARHGAGGPGWAGGASRPGQRGEPPGWEPLCPPSSACPAAAHPGARSLPSARQDRPWALFSQAHWWVGSMTRWLLLLVRVKWHRKECIKRGYRSQFNRIHLL